MILGGADVELRMPGIAIVFIGVGCLPVIMTKMRLGKGDQHSGIIGRLENFSEAQMCSRFATVVMGINKVDAESFETLKAFARRLVSCQRGANLRIVQRHGG